MWTPIDIEVTTVDVEEFITTVRNIGPTFGGINLEDIKSPECFVIESRLRDELDIRCFTMTSMARRSSRQLASGMRASRLAAI